MRVSNFSLNTLRDTPAEAELSSHVLLLRGGFIKKVSSGIYAYMPLMWKVLKKVIKIVEEEMDKKGYLQTLLPQLHPSELWEASGRWKGYTDGEGIMFNLSDRQNKRYGLAPTHEEVITKIVGEIINSYKQLPITFYQIQTKFRDEIRPRFGLMRSREFIMKDAYSFHCNHEDLQSTYKDMADVYKKIFKRCGLKTVAVDADSGAIGGSASQEYMVTAKSGEDLILISTDGKYAANQEKAVSNYSNYIPTNFTEERIIDTPNQKTINELCTSNNFHPSQIVKVIVLVAYLEKDIKQPVLVCLRGDHELNEIKLSNYISNIYKSSVFELKPLTKDLLISEGLTDLPFGSIGPDLNNELLTKAKTWEKTFFKCSDLAVKDLKNFICGSNSLDKHKTGVNWKNLGGIKNCTDLRKAKGNDICLHNSNEFLKESRGIEVGHIFQLGKKYTDSIGAQFTNKKGGQESIWMGCYGIGISRLAQAAVEQSHDDSGLIWPLSIAPYEVIITIANMKDLKQVELGEKIYEDLLKKNVEVLFDDREERAGIKFKDADLIGIPLRIVVGRDSIQNKVELFERLSKKTELLSAEVAIEKIIKKIQMT